MTYITLPTLKDFQAYAGETLDGKLSGDIKNQNDMWETLCKRCYREIKMNLKGIEIDDLTDDDLSNWHILIMEQAEYYLSLGDRVLTGDSNSGLSPNVVELAIDFALWSAVIC